MKLHELIEELQKHDLESHVEFDARVSDSLGREFNEKCLFVEAIRDVDTRRIATIIMVQERP